MKLMDKIGDKEVKIKSSVHYLYMSPESPLTCDHCYKSLGLWRSLYHALGKKKGDPYLVVCKHCKEINKRIKGEAGKKLDDRWD